MSEARALGHPLVLAEALVVYAEGELGNSEGRAGEAAALREAVQLAARARAPSIEARALTVLIRVLVQEGKAAQGRELLVAAESAAERAGNDPRTRGRVYYAAGRAAHEIPDLPAAVSLYRQALALEEGRDDPLSERQVANFTNSLGVALRDQGKLDEAAAALERARQAYETLYGPDFPSIAGVLLNLGLLHVQRGDLAEARRTDERALAILDKALGPAHVDVGRALTNLAQVHYLQGDFPAAESLGLRSLGVKEKVVGPDHPLLVSSLENTTSALLRQARFAEARPYCERAIAIKEKQRGPQHAELVEGLLLCALADASEGKLAAAEERRGRAQAILAKAGAPRAETQIFFAEVTLAERRFEEAKKLLDEAAARTDLRAHHQAELARLRALLPR
jgi:tetratricopeptide (TPR) repeat protein